MLFLEHMASVKCKYFCSFEWLNTAAETRHQPTAVLCEKKQQQFIREKIPKMC